MDWDRPAVGRPIWDRLPLVQKIFTINGTDCLGAAKRGHFVSEPFGK